MIKVMSVTPEKLAFLARLNEVVAMLDYPERGKQTMLAAKYGVTQGACRKWFAAESMPSYEICIDLCRRSKVTYEWMMTGRGDKMMPEAQKAPQVEPMRAELQWLRGDESEMLSLYRCISDDNRHALRLMAQGMPKVLQLGIAGN